MSKNKRHCPLCGSPSDAWAETVKKPVAPWEQAGMSRRTYYRRLQTAREDGEAQVLEEATERRRSRGAP